jgi:hypothetical protein
MYAWNLLIRLFHLHWCMIISINNILISMLSWYQIWKFSIIATHCNCNELCDTLLTYIKISVCLFVWMWSQCNPPKSPPTHPKTYFSPFWKKIPFDENWLEKRDGMECYSFQSSLLFSAYLYCTLHQVFSTPKTLSTILCLKEDLMGFHVKIVLGHKSLIIT